MQGINLAQIDAAAQLYQDRELNLKAKQDDARDQQLIRSTAKAAIDPKTGEYDPTLHAQALEKAGFPEVAQKYRIETARRLEQSYKALDQALPMMNEQNWPAVRQGLVQQGMPDNMIPQQFDPQWLMQQRDRLGLAVKKFGPYQKQANGPSGTELYGQENTLTGELENAQVLRPAGVGSRGGVGGRAPAPSDPEKRARFYAQVYGIPLDVALDVVRSERLGEGPFKMFQRLSNTMLNQFSTPQEAADAARELVESLYGPGSVGFAAVPGRPLAGRGRPPARPGQVQPRMPDTTGWQPRVIYELRNGTSWKLGPDGRTPVQVK